MPTENPLVPFRFDASASGADAPADVEDADAAAVADDAEDVEAIPVQDGESECHPTGSTWTTGPGNGSGKTWPCSFSIDAGL